MSTTTIRVSGTTHQRSVGKWHPRSNPQDHINIAAVTTPPPPVTTRSTRVNLCAIAALMEPHRAAVSIPPPAVIIRSIRVNPCALLDVDAALMEP